MAGPDHHLVHVGLGRRTFDSAHRGRLADVVDLAHERQHRAGDIGERDQLAIDGEAAGHHPVVCHELFEQFRDRRAGPGDPAFTVQEAALLFARQQRLTVVQLQQELDAGLRRLEGVEELESGASQPAGNVDAVEHMVGQEVRDDDAHIGRDSHRQRSQGVHRGTEGDHTGDILGPAVGRGLIAEHAALGVAHQVDGLTGGGGDDVDGLAERDDVVGQGAFHTALDLVGRAVVDHPGVDTGGMQDADRAVLAGDVPHIRRHHHGVDHQRGRSRGFAAGPVVRREVPPELVHVVALDDLEGRRHRPGLQAAPARHLVPVLGGRDKPLQGSGDRRQIEIYHRCSLPEL